MKAKYHDFINLGFELRDQDCITLIHELNRNFEASRVDQIYTEKDERKKDKLPEKFISGSEVDGSEASSIRDQLHIEEPESQGILSSGVQMSNRDFINLTEDLNHKFEASQEGDVIVTDHADNPNTAFENQDETEVVSATSHTVDEETEYEKVDRLY